MRTCERNNSADTKVNAEGGGGAPGTGAEIPTCDGDAHWIRGVAELEFIPHSSLPSTVLCPGSWKGAENTPVFWPLLGRAGTASVLTLNIPS